MTQCNSTVVVIIPCLNEAPYISRCLESLLAQDYDRELLEIVVVDGISDDGTREIVGRYAGQYSFIRLLDNHRQDKSSALNLAINETSADVVIRADAHATYAADYVSRLVDGLTLHGADNIGGIRETDTGRTAWQRAVSIAISHPFAAGNAHYRTGVRNSRPRQVDTVFGGCYRRSVFQRIGGFHRRLVRTQDREFNTRLSQHGGRTVLDPAIRCTYFPRTNWRRYASWTWAGAFWLFYASRFCDTKMRGWRNYVPVAFVLWHVAALLAALVEPLWGLWLVMPLVAYWCICISVAWREASHARCASLLPALIILLPTTHFSYGIGAVCGLVAAAWQGKDRGASQVYAGESFVSQPGTG